MYKDLRFTKCSKGATRKMTLIQLMNNVGYTGRLLWKNMDSKEKLTSVLNIQDSLHCAICLIQDDMQATKHAVAVDFKLKLVYDGYSSQPMELHHCMWYRPQMYWYRYCYGSNKPKEKEKVM